MKWDKFPYISNFIVLVYLPDVRFIIEFQALYSVGEYYLQPKSQNWQIQNHIEPTGRDKLLNAKTKM